MKICESAKSRAAALKSIKPVRIAVAFLGEDWRRYVVYPGLLEAVIVSPKPGSNPFAIEELGDAIGWDKLYLLEDLHSKLYIGQESAFLGSPNLSANGFGDNGNYELGVLLTNENSIRKLNKIFDSYRKKADADYPTKPEKLERLARLVLDWQKAIANRLIFEDTAQESAVPNLKDYSFSKLNRIHVIWGANAEGGRVNRSAIQQEIPEAARLEQAALEEYFSDCWEVHPSDDAICVGDWILGWRSTHAGVPPRNSVGTSISWTFVDFAIKNGYTDTEYTQLVGQAPAKDHPDPPFDLDDDNTRRAIMNVLRSGQFPQMLGTYNDADLWRADTAFPYVIKFLKAVRRQILSIAAG